MATPALTLAHHAVFEAADRDQSAFAADMFARIADQGIELSVVMPCLNEAETVASCVRKAAAFLARSGISGEIVVADNGSTDGSQTPRRRGRCARRRGRGPR